MRMSRLTALAAAIGSAVILARCGGNTPNGPDPPPCTGTGCNPPPAATATILAAGDVGECGFGALQTGTLLDGLSGDFILALGDLAYPDGSAANFRDCFDPGWGRHKSRTRPVPGNHEYVSDSAANPYFNYFGANGGNRGEGYYAFNAGPWRIIALNDNIPFGPGTAQMQFLRTELQNNRVNCVLAYWHKPLYSSGQNGNANDGVQSKLLWTTLLEFNADVILNGHDHLYERFALQDDNGRPGVNGIREFVVGTGGAHLYPLIATKPNSEKFYNSSYGILSLTLFEKSYHWEFRSVTNSLIDAGDGACH
jgi:hypothetical protein